MNKGQDLYRKAKKIIPGGTQLLSKRPEMFLPGSWPAYYKRAKGCLIWDLDNRQYIDMSYMGIGSCILGYADPDVDRAANKAIKNANMTTLNVPEEVELGELLIGLHPWAHMVRYARCGGEAMAIAVRIARAATGRDMVLFSGYHGWHDWYLAANLASDKALDGHLLPGLSPLGVPRRLMGTAYPFRYNDSSSLLRLVKQYNGKVGAIVMESVRNSTPDKEFIDIVKRAARGLKAVLIVDEITSGFRLNAGGAHLLFGLEPDMAVFAKGISNGFPMAAVIGKRKIMQAAQGTFISSTYWTDRIGPSAAIATIKKIQSRDVPRHLLYAGKRIQDGWKASARRHKLRIELSGIPPLSHFIFMHKDPLVLKTLFTQLMLEKGFLATNAFYASYAHKDTYISSYLKAADESFCFISKAVIGNNAKRYLKGPVCHAGFKRLA